MEQQEKIMYKAFELFKRYGIRSVTMDEIAGQCGVSKKTVYQFFEDKDTLVETIMRTFIGKTETLCSGFATISENAIHEVFLSADMVAEMMEGINPALMYDMRKYHGNAFQILQEHKKKFLLEFLKQNMQRGIAEGLYREELKVDIISMYQLHNMTLVFEEDIFPKTKYSLVEIDYELTLYNLYGQATTKGIKQIEKYKQQRLKQQTV